MLGNYVRAMRRGHYDIVDAWLYPDDVLAATMRLLTGTPIVMSGRRNIQSHDRFGTLAPSVDRLVDRLTDVVVANSNAAAENAIRSHHTTASKLRIIRNGVALVEPLSAAERSTWRRRMGVPDDDVVLGCVGRYHRVKRHSLLIEAFARLAPERPGLSLVIVGDGDQRVALENQVDGLGLRDRVRLHGNERDPRPMYGAFDMVAQASSTEGLPNALLEAAAAGCPIVATDAGGTREIVVDGLTGLLVPIEDVDALAGGLRRLATDPGLRERLGRAARDRVERQFSMSRFVKEYGDLYQELVEARGLRP